MKIAADLMTEFFRYNKVNEKNMHCIGFSLGAHMCAIFYQTYTDKFKIKPERITGLDPAGPMFGSKPLNEKLSYLNANFVDIIHTSKNFGSDEKLGHMDFYVS
jgi:pancreatic triacylglycerol lipase